MNAFKRAVYLLSKAELGEISSDETRSELKKLNDQMKADPESQPDPPPADPNQPPAYGQTPGY